MKNKEAYSLNEELKKYSNINGKKFAYAVFKNKEILQSFMEDFNSKRKQPHPDFLNYENERNLICTKYSKKDVNGNPLTRMNEFGQNEYDIIPEKKEELDKELNELSEQYKEIIMEVQKDINDFNFYLEQEVSVKLNLVTVKYEDLPNSITASELEKIKWMVE